MRLKVSYGIMMAVCMLALTMLPFSLEAVEFYRGGDSLDCRTEIVFLEDFGSGPVNPGPELPPGTITYCFEDLSGSCPSNAGITPGSLDDGSYSIMNDPRPGLIFANGDTTGWLAQEDHTVGDIDGYMLVVNASFETGEFYRLNDIPVINGEEYAFSAWFANILTQVSLDNCGAFEVPVNVNFIVEDAGTGSLLGSLSSGDIFGTGTPLWVPSEFLFTATSDFINIVLVNNAPGGCGNDFAIDDIQLMGCIANTTMAVSDSLTGCEPSFITGNLLDNDIDDQGDDQAVTSIIVDTDGDLIADTEIMPGQFVSVGGASDSLGPYPNIGTLEVGVDGVFEFIHEPLNLPGTVLFEYVICDDGIPVICDTGLAVIQITCDPNSTQAVDDSIIGCEMTGIIGNILANDEDVENHTQSVSSLIIDTDGDLVPDTEAATGQVLTVGGLSDDLGAFTGIGTLTVGTNGTIRFNHEPLNLPGTVVFDYIMCDNGVPVECDTARVTISITCDPNATDAVNDFFAGCDTAGISGNVLDNDIDLEGDGLTVTSVIVDFDGDLVPETQVFPGQVNNVGGESDSLGPYPGIGILTVSSDGSVLLEHDPLNLPGNVVFDYVICDDGLPVACDTARGTIRISCNANTTLANDDDFSGCEPNGITGNLLANDADLEMHSQELTVVIIDTDGDLVPETSVSTGQSVTVGGLSDSLGAVGNMGTVMVGSEGAFVLEHEPVNLSGTVVFQYVVCDDGIPSACDTATVTVTITCLPPVINTTDAMDDELRGCIFMGIEGNVLDNDFDEQGDDQEIILLFIDTDGDLLVDTSFIPGQTLTAGGLSDDLGPVAEMGSLFVDQDGYVLFEHEPLNLAGQIVFSYVVCDDGDPQACDTADVLIEITCEPIDTLQCRTEIVFTEDFGSGQINPGPELPPGTTTYCYENLSGSCPSNPGVTAGSIDDGSYSIMNDPRPGLIFLPDDTVGWSSIEDHTPGDTSGYMLVVNADFETGEFYRLNDIAVVTGEDYTFSAWFANILSEVSVQGCGASQVAVNVLFIVEDAVSGSVLGSLSTGDIFSNGQPEWVVTEFLFVPTSSLINIVLVNNSPGGCGNDFAIDDIQLTGCVANTTFAEDDLLEGCQVGGLTADLLQNDTDDQGNSQLITSILVDLDGDLVPESVATVDTPVNVGGLSDNEGPIANMGELTVGTGGSVIYNHQPQDIAGLVVFDYIICDDGIPSVCDTARVTISVTCVEDSLQCPFEVVFRQDFGSGLTNPGPDLPPGTITYCYEDLSGTCPSDPFLTPGSINDGSYSVMNDPLTGIIYAAGDTTAWISTEDHTPGDTNGYMLVINADFDPGEFYRLNDIPVNPGENYAFSAWFINILSRVSLDICLENEVPVNVMFEVEDASNGSLLGSITTGDIFASSNPQWIQQEFIFAATSPSINIVLSNNGSGGCGNDFCIDDIELLGCIANTTDAVDDNYTVLPCDTLERYLLSNDFDEEGHSQQFQSYSYDANGDGVVESTGIVDSLIAVAGMDPNGNPVVMVGSLLMDSNGNLEFFAAESFEGTVNLSYIICDDGIPVICDTAEVVIDVEACSDPCIIPEFISPNGDALNDVFYIECAEDLPALRVMFYNRWGNQVYDSGPGYDNTWAGTYGRKGQPLPEGVYFYIVQFNDEENTTQAGDLLILR